MRCALFSDVHGNLEALTAMLSRLEAMGPIDRWFCLGDIVGYGADPDDCCTLVRERADVTLLGNHDAAVAGRMDYDYYYDAARDALDWCRERLSPENMQWLGKLPYTHREEELEISHGSPLRPEDYDYIFTTDQARDMVRSYDAAKVTFIGHSHLTKAFAVSEEDAEDVVSTKFKLRDGYRYVITVGSVGQPRDYDPRACAGIYDSVSESFEFVRVDYDVDAQRQKINDAGLSPSFGTRLLLGI
ncbi:MAG: metallophosphoesterase family protein [Myxococcota bacterium]